MNQFCATASTLITFDVRFVFERICIERPYYFSNDVTVGKEEGDAREEDINVRRFAKKLQLISSQKPSGLIA